MDPHNPCPRCRKARMTTKNQAKRAARALGHNSQNDHRVFTIKMCRCRGRPWIVATTDQDHHHARRARMEIEQRILDEEERDVVVSNIIEDARQFMTDPQAHWSWLSRTYSDKIANDIINQAYTALKEQPK